MRDHDTEKAQELMYERNIQARLYVRRGDLGEHLPIPQTRCSGRVEKETSVGIEAQGFGRMDGNFGGRVAVRDKNRPGSILASQTRVAPQ